MAPPRALLIAASLVSFAAGRSAWVPLIDDQTRESVGDIKWDIDNPLARTNEEVLREACAAIDRAWGGADCEALRAQLDARGRVLRVSARHEERTCGDAGSCRARRRELFEHVYEAGVWNSNNPDVPPSGIGSGRAAARLAETLDAVVRRYGVLSILDVGCGDASVVDAADLAGVEEYLGVDISAPILERNTAPGGVGARLRGRVPSVRFAVLDAVSEELPEGADLVIVRDMMGHLGPRDNAQFLANLARAAPKYLLMKTYLRGANPYDEDDGADFPLAFGHCANLFAEPYCAADPLELYRDDGFDAFMGLWKVAPDGPPGVLATTVDDDASVATLGDPAARGTPRYGVWANCSLGDLQLRHSAYRITDD